MLFYGIVILMSAAAGIHESTFNNFLSDTFHLKAGSRGWLELPREAPGFLVVVMTGLLAALPVTRMGIVGTATMAFGLTGLAVFGKSFWPMFAMMVINSAGLHLLQPVGSSIAIGLSDAATRGKRLGQQGSFEKVGVILGTGFVWLMYNKVKPQYQMGFLCAGGLAACASIVYSRMHIPHLHQPRARMVFRKKFMLYYLLELCFGARKQIFITFGPWVLIKIYGQPAASIAGLMMTTAVIGIFFKPIAGLAIDRFGERAVLVADALLLVFVCLGYGYAANWMGGAEHARVLACACFIMDDLLFSLGTGRSVYASRLADNPQELTSTLAMGVSINHLVSMLIPTVAGLVWDHLGYQRVFLAAAILAFAISALAWHVPAKKKA